MQPQPLSVGLFRVTGSVVDGPESVGILEARAALGPDRSMAVAVWHIAAPGPPRRGHHDGGSPGPEVGPQRRRPGPRPLAGPSIPSQVCTDPVPYRGLHRQST
jgi:hypothetical protein